jgi:hypothetical protein
MAMGPVRWRRRGGLAAGAPEAAAGGPAASGGQAGRDVLADVPDDSAAAEILPEHQWAVPLRDAIIRAGGFRLGDGFISPLDLAGIGLMSDREAQGLHQLEMSAAVR